MPKKIIAILAVALLVLFCSVLTFGYDDIKSVLSKPFILTDEQKLELIQKAEIFGVDPNGHSDEQLFFEVKAKEDEAMIAKAKSAGIHTDGLTADQVRIKIEEWDKEIPLRRAEEEKIFYFEEAKMYGIDTAGLSLDEIKERVNEELMPYLIKKAEEFGIKYEGLSYDQLLRSVKEKETKPDPVLTGASIEVNVEEIVVKPEPEAASANEQIVPSVQIPLIMTGIVVENSSEYTGHIITVNRGSLPEWAQGYSRIGIAESCFTPFDVPLNGLPFNSESILSYLESPIGITTVGSILTSSKWYILVALYDENNNPIGYCSTSVDVADSGNLQVPAEDSESDKLPPKLEPSDEDTLPEQPL